MEPPPAIGADAWRTVPQRGHAPQASPDRTVSRIASCSFSEKGGRDGGGAGDGRTDLALDGWSGFMTPALSPWTML
jgi:hypothetical protein